MRPEQFDLIADNIWKSLLPVIPAELKAHFGKILFVVEDRPPGELLAELDNDEWSESPESLCGLFTGVPLTEASLMDPSPFPAKIYLFREALLREASYDSTRAGMRRLKEQIAVTLLHEVGHFFGLDEDDLERLGFD